MGAAVVEEEDDPPPAIINIMVLNASGPKLDFICWRMAAWARVSLSMAMVVAPPSKVTFMPEEEELDVKG